MLERCPYREVSVPRGSTVDVFLSTAGPRQSNIGDFEGFAFGVYLRVVRERRRTQNLQNR